MKKFELSRRALRDLHEIWEFVSGDSLTAADRLLEDFYQAFQNLASMPRIGHRRTDLTERDVFFWPLHSYLVIYKDSKPLQVARVLHAKRDVKRLLKNR